MPKLSPRTLVDPIMNRLIFQPTPGLPETPAAHGIPFEDLTLRTEDGVHINAWFVPAQGKPRAHLLYAHGNGGTIGDRVAIIALLTRAGFDVLAFDYRGFGKSAGSPTERGTYLDARAARQALLDHGADPNRLVYLGKSLGGAVMLELAQEFPPAALILMSTFSSMRDAAKSVYPILPKPLIPNAYPSVDRIARTHVPLLMLHGTDDELLPIDHAHRLFAAANEPKRIEVVAGAGHNDVIAALGRRWTDLLGSWTDQVLAAAE
ncbi:alpha/beta hydrolase [Nocardia camponoti]|uniref:AB hydrolase-1 domain-containing protein n=1 Tax=Nocardia camponoti TaxID=1616106 RepID=A0A917QU08_9NOCA|nr:alpha/beta hydrolase [Nocardia camponoti]GGK67703.1 hypothetical protein GCM10011591_44840 [Nocardia camponoti]